MACVAARVASILPSHRPSGRDVPWIPVLARAHFAIHLTLLYHAPAAHKGCVRAKGWNRGACLIGTHHHAALLLKVLAPACTGCISLF